MIPNLHCMRVRFWEYVSPGSLLLAVILHPVLSLHVCGSSFCLCVRWSFVHASGREKVYLSLLLCGFEVELL